MIKGIYILILCTLIPYQLFAQVSADFNLPSEVCLEQQFQLENTSVNADNYEWDFCFEDFSTLTPSFDSFSSSGLSLPFEARIIQSDTSSFVFIPNRNGNTIRRYHVSNDFNTIYSENNVENINSYFQEPISIDIKHINNKWIGFASDFSLDKVFILDFGNNLNAAPSIEELQLNTIALDGATRIHIEDGNDSTFLFLSNFGTAKLSKIVLENSDLLTTVVENEYTIPGAGGLSSFDIIKYNPNNWLMLLGQSSGNTLIKLKFNSSLNSDPVIENLANTGDAYTKPTGPQIFREGDNFYALLINRGGQFFRLDFGNDIESVPAVTNYGIATGSNASWSFDLIKNDSSRFIGFFTKFNSNLAIKVSFDDPCSASPVYSSEVEPIVKYNSSGTKNINLNAFNSNGEVNTISKSLNVTVDKAPIGQIILDSVYCIADNISFSFDTQDDIKIYDWDFGDGNTNTTISPTHQYATEGEYIISLEVESAAGCPNIFYDTLTILPEPQPEFSTTDTEYCTFESIAFNNTTPFDFGENVDWSWDFNGEGGSTEENPDFIFESAGTKTITLEANVLGCLQTFQSTLEIIEGPEVDFSYDSNCLGEAIQFTNLSTGANITGYQWDFGNGESSTSENPQMTYNNGGIYSVALTVTNASGCENITTQNIQVFEQVVDSIMATEAIENLPFNLGIDWRNDFDSTQTLSYEWKIDGETQVADTATYTLPQGIYSVNLEITAESNCLFTTQSFVEVKVSESPTPDFNLPSEVCLQEQFEIENTSINADAFEWVFCVNDYDSLNPNFNLVLDNKLSQAYESRIFSSSESESYVFIPNRGSGEIRRLKSSDDFESIDSDNLLSSKYSNQNGPVSIDLIKLNDSWQGFVIDFFNEELFYVNFGSSLDNEPSFSKVPITGAPLNGPFRVELVENDSEHYLVISNYTSQILKVIKFQNSVLTEIESEQDIFIPDVTNLTSFDIMNVEGNKFILLLGAQQNNLVKLEFPDGLNSNPSISKINPNNLTLQRSTGVYMFEVAGNYYSYIQSRDGDFYLLNFGNSYLNVPIGRNFGSIDDSNITWSIDFYRTNSIRLVGLIPKFSNNNLYRVSFEDECSSSLPKSEDVNPVTSYSQPGTYPITLTAYHPNGNSASITKEITVTENQAPEIVFATGEDLCVGAPIQFSSESNKEISSYSWDFGDGNTSTEANPDHLFSSAGEYLVELSVTDTAGCNNLFQDSISVYAEPQPDFQASAQGTICSQKPVVFENTTSLPTTASFQWDFGDGSTSTEENPEHIYAEEGEYIINFQIEMAGCLVEKTDTISVNPGPLVDFNYNDDCFGQVVNFENSSTGEFLQSFQWNFGDGSQSTQTSPNHSYDSAGSYNVKLSAFTSNGCDYTFEKQVVVHPVATVAFQSEVACANQAVQFNEQVTLQQSNVTDYLWDFGVAGTTSDVSTSANPQFAFPAAGNYQVRLQVTTADGCTTSGTQTVAVQALPQPAFTYEDNCLSNAILFSPQNTDNIIAHFWELQDETGAVVFTAQSENFSYAFENPGTYQLRYRQQNENLCSNSITESIEILPLPTPDFQVGSICANAAITFENLTDLKGNILKNYNWSINGDVISTDFRPQYSFQNSGDFLLGLQVETQNGCIQSIEKTITVSPSPEAFFELEQTLAAYPYTLSLNAEEYQVSSIKYQDEQATKMANRTVPVSPLGTKGLSTSPLGIEGLWTLNGDTISTTPALNHTITQTGTYLLGLILTNEAGCTDSHFEQIRIREPNLDIALSNLSITQDDDFTSFVLNISNKGTLVPERLDLEIDLGSYSVTETIEEPLLTERNRNVALSIKLTEEQIRGLAKICIRAIPQSAASDERNESNNRVCTNIESGLNIMEIYPNPVVTNFTLPMILPENANVTLSLEQSNGQNVKVYSYDLEAGYNEIQLDRENLKPGIYFLRIRYQGEEKAKKIIFQ
ncbi:hypothetical protein MATR_01510 [Marivirga tractuosa]|uniref:PKD domain containing protein n=1 Tax=Marivirga tractuosa (strain ATCC 23168 / DSM 4126 / NBRC 15989 / NCIMB 1408 / VKM B-1430 / H-43) TaxID=643867 RepID=E4TVW0_MARTH|nr:PKD domain-containing protein [Marivirga tractuosa]ADR22208.1 PKD domain containing protein [Marivirga tractuosa DSM 4126]BDD13326.1 hypothetical protein MATR_01510 [Marivirga tractuosa]